MFWRLIQCNFVDRFKFAQSAVKQVFGRELSATITTSADVFLLQEELCVSILEAYVKYLIEAKHVELVATYVALLPKEMQVEWYAKFLEGQ